MGGEWKEYSVDDVKAPVPNALATGPFGSSIGSQHFRDEGVPLLRGSNLSHETGKRLVEEDLTFVTSQKAAEHERSMVRHGDLVFTCWGNINQVGLIDERSRYPEYLLSNKQMKLTPNSQRFDSLFLYYLFSSPQIQQQISSQEIGSTIPGFNLSQLRALRIHAPPLEEQRRIARALGVLDDRIEVNQRIGDTLESMARALFKSWFVNFDPVRAKVEGRETGLPVEIAELFPDGFAESELGQIPSGWHVGRFGDVVEQLREQENPLTSPEVRFLHLSIPAFDDGQNPKAERGEDIKSHKFRVPVGAVLLSKLNPEIERVWLVDLRPTDRAVCSTEFLVLRARSAFTRAFVYCLARSPLFRQQLEGLVTGTSKSHQRAQAASVLNLSVVVPPSEIVAAFDRLTEHQLARSLQSRRESRTISALRVGLLPLLLSGGRHVAEERKIAARVD